MMSTEAMISMKEHLRIIAAYQDRIKILQRELEQKETFLNENEIEKDISMKIRQSTMVLDDLIGIEDDIEDILTDDDDDEDAHAKSLLNHNRRATSLIIEDLIGFDDEIGDDDDSDSVSTASLTDVNKNGREYKSIGDVDELKKIIESLQNELTTKSKLNALHHINPETMNQRDEMDWVLQSKLELIACLSQELDKMRSIIKSQQRIIRACSVKYN